AGSLRHQEALRALQDRQAQGTALRGVPQGSQAQAAAGDLHGDRRGRDCGGGGAGDEHGHGRGLWQRGGGVVASTRGMRVLRGCGRVGREGGARGHRGVDAGGQLSQTTARLAPPANRAAPPL
ncbi:predicted protein, partial [Micromonas commoda]